MTRIVPLDRYNWELCLDIHLHPDQEQFTPSVLYSLAQAKFEQLKPYGILYKGDMVGFLMYGEFSGICWINRIQIDKNHQRQGIGMAALKQLLEMLRMKRSCREIRTSYSKHNYVASRFFEALGFQPLPEAVADETVAVLKPKTPANI